MDFTTIKSGNGFINDQDLFNRMAHFRPPKGEKYVLRRTDIGSFLPWVFRFNICKSLWCFSRSVGFSRAIVICISIFLRWFSGCRTN